MRCTHRVAAPLAVPAVGQHTGGVVGGERHCIEVLAPVAAYWRAVGRRDGHRGGVGAAGVGGHDAQCVGAGCSVGQLCVRQRGVHRVCPGGVEQRAVPGVDEACRVALCESGGVGVGFMALNSIESLEGEYRWAGAAHLHIVHVQVAVPAYRPVDGLVAESDVYHLPGVGRQADAALGGVVGRAAELCRVGIECGVGGQVCAVAVGADHHAVGVVEVHVRRPQAPEQSHAVGDIGRHCYGWRDYPAVHRIAVAVRGYAAVLIGVVYALCVGPVGRPVATCGQVPAAEVVREGLVPGVDGVTCLCRHGHGGGHQRRQE